MSNTNKFLVGHKYKLVDASRDINTQVAVESGALGFPTDKTFVCHGTHLGDCTTTTDGVTWRGCPAVCSETGSWLCASLEALNAGAFEEVLDEQH